MRKKQTRISVTKTFTMPPELAAFVVQRGAKLNGNESLYIQKLIQHDREENTLAAVARKDADRLSTVPA